MKGERTREKSQTSFAAFEAGRTNKGLESSSTQNKPLARESHGTGCNLLAFHSGKEMKALREQKLRFQNPGK